MDLYGTGDPNALFRLKIIENDINAFADKQVVKTEYISTASNSLSNRPVDYYFHDLPLDFKGWKAFAINYSAMKLDMKNSTSNLIKEPKKISAIFYTVINNNKREGTVGVNMDYLMILYSKGKKIEK